MIQPRVLASGGVRPVAGSSPVSRAGNRRCGGARAAREVPGQQARHPMPVVGSIRGAGTLSLREAVEGAHPLCHLPAALGAQELEGKFLGSDGGVQHERHGPSRGKLADMQPGVRGAGNG